jgi:hypothetical protein
MMIPDVSRTRWRKSSDGADNGNCIELAAWRKSSYSSENGACVEAAADGAVVAVRDNKDPNGPHLEFGPEVWRTFAARMKATATQA